eukprot:5544492-Karenia_brevis.AAC.1
MLMCGLLLPVAVGYVRAPVAHLVTASDATPSSGGSVKAPVSFGLAEKLYQSSEYRGASVALEPL